MYEQMSEELKNKTGKYSYYRTDTIVLLYKSGIITQAEARDFLGFPNINSAEMRMDLPKFRKVKNARNRYDYLCRKLNENKHLSDRDEEDYCTLYELFESSMSENDKIQTISEKIQTHELA